MRYNGSSPEVFGPPLWFVFHNAAAHYPEAAAPIERERMKNILIGMPSLLPCAECKEHATMHIERNRANLDTITAGRRNLVRFFVDFHNYVNKRKGKPLFTYEEAERLYG